MFMIINKHNLRLTLSLHIFVTFLTPIGYTWLLEKTTILIFHYILKQYISFTYCNSFYKELIFFCYTWLTSALLTSLYQYICACILLSFLLWLALCWIHMFTVIDDIQVPLWLALCLYGVHPLALVWPQRNSNVCLENLVSFISICDKCSSCCKYCILIFNHHMYMYM